MTDLAIPEERNDELRIEKWIWRNVGRQSVREMAAELGVSPEAVLKVKRDMVDSVDDITVQVQRMKLIRQLQNMGDDVLERLDQVSDDRNYAGIANAFTSASKALLVELGRVSKGQDEAVSALNDLRRKEIVAMYVEVVNTSVAEIASEHGLDESEVFEVFNRNLQAAASRRDV